jgi:hypothetical protein
MVKETLLYAVLVCTFLQTHGRLHAHLLESLQNVAARHFPPTVTLVTSCSTETNAEKVNMGRRRRRDAALTDRGYERDPCPDIQEALLVKLHQHEKWPFLLYNSPVGMKRKEQHKHGGYIICIRAAKVAEQVRNQLNQLKNTGGWNSRAHFVIVVTSELDYSFFGNVLAEDILAEFWRDKIVNVAVLLPASHSSKISFGDSTQGAEKMELVVLQEVYSFFPYQPQNKCGNVMHASLLDYWVQNYSAEGRFLRNVPLFPSKIPPDLQGCTLSVSTLDLEPMVMTRKSAYDDGLEIRMLNTILSYMNVSAWFLPPQPKDEKWGRHLSNGSWDGVIGRVTSGRSDIGIGGIVVSNMAQDSADVTFSYLEQNINWYVPCAKASPHTATITRVFTTAVWLCVAMIYITVSVLAWCLFKSQWKSPESFKNISLSLTTCLLNLWVVMLGISASIRLPNFASFRMLYILWIFYSLGLNTVYQAFLTTYLVEPRLDKPLYTEQELIQSGIQLGINPHFEESENNTFISRYPNMIPCPDIEKCLRRLAEKGDIAVLCAQLIGDYIGTFKFPNAKGKPAYCKLDEQYATLNMAMFLQKGDPLLSYFNKAILRVFEAGLFGLWWRDLKHNATLSSKKIFLTTRNVEFEPLTMYHLQSCFYAQCIGNILSLGTFVCEVMTQFHKRGRGWRHNINCCNYLPNLVKNKFISLTDRGGL